MIVQHDNEKKRFLVFRGNAGYNSVGIPNNVKVQWFHDAKLDCIVIYASRRNSHGDYYNHKILVDNTAETNQWLMENADSCCNVMWSTHQTSRPSFTRIDDRGVKTHHQDLIRAIYGYAERRHVKYVNTQWEDTDAHDFDARSTNIRFFDVRNSKAPIVEDGKEIEPALFKARSDLNTRFEIETTRYGTSVTDNDSLIQFFARLPDEDAATNRKRAVDFLNVLVKHLTHPNLLSSRKKREKLTVARIVFDNDEWKENILEQIIIR